MAYTNPSVADFQNQFFRDFPYGLDPDTCVLNQDILNAFGLANMGMNQALWMDQPSYTIGYLLLSAHYMVMSLRASSQGLNGQYNWTQNSKSVQAVSEAFTIPQRIIDNPELMMLTKTQYGGLYLQLLLPKLIGQAFCVFGGTKP